MEIFAHGACPDYEKSYFLPLKLTRIGASQFKIILVNEPTCISLPKFPSKFDFDIRTNVLICYNSKGATLHFVLPDRKIVYLMMIRRFSASRSNLLLSVLRSENSRTIEKVVVSFCTMENMINRFVFNVANYEWGGEK